MDKKIFIAKKLLDLAHVIVGKNDKYDEIKKHAGNDDKIAQWISGNGGSWNSSTGRFDFDGINNGIPYFLISNGKLKIDIGEVKRTFNCGNITLDSLDELPRKVGGQISGKINGKPPAEFVGKTGSSAETVDDNEDKSTGITEDKEDGASDENDGAYSSGSYFYTLQDMLELRNTDAYKKCWEVISSKLWWNKANRVWDSKNSKNIDPNDLQYLIENGKFIVKFGELKSSFDCSGLGLTSLEGAPSSVGGDFYCYKNQLTSLKGAPSSVGGDFSCSNNQLTSLEGAPSSVGRDFDCSNNQLTSLEGAPSSVGRGFYCSNNQLTSLEGAPSSVYGYGCFYCSNNQLTSLEGAPSSVGGNFSCKNNPLKSFKGRPNKIGGGFACNGCGNVPDISDLNGIDCYAFACDSYFNLEELDVKANRFDINERPYKDKFVGIKNELKKTVEKITEEGDKKGLKLLYDKGKITQKKLKSILDSTSDSDFAMYIMSDLLGWKNFYKDQTLLNFFLNHGGVIRSDDPEAGEFSKNNIESMVDNFNCPDTSVFIYAIENGYLDKEKFQNNIDQYSEMICKWIDNNKVSNDDLKKIIEKIKVISGAMSSKIIIQIISAEIRNRRWSGLDVIADSGFDKQVTDFASNLADHFRDRKNCEKKSIYKSILAMMSHIKQDSLEGFLQELIIEIASSTTNTYIAEGGGHSENDVNAISNANFAGLFDIINNDTIKNLIGKNNLFSRVVDILVNDKVHGVTGAPVTASRFIIEGYRTGYELVNKSLFNDVMNKITDAYRNKSAHSVLNYMDFYYNKTGDSSSIANVFKKWISESSKSSRILAILKVAQEKYGNNELKAFTNLMKIAKQNNIVF